MVSTDKFNLLHSYIFKKKDISVDINLLYKDKSILYICQNGTSGYANAAKGYIYDYISKKLPVKVQYFNCNDAVNENDRFHQYLNSNSNAEVNYNVVIAHSTPDIWDVLIKNTPNIKLENKLIIGRTVWEFEKLISSWVDAINASIVDIVSVPTEWNKQSFIKNGVTKPIIVEPHVCIDYPHNKTGLKHLLSKSVTITKSNDSVNLQDYYKFYCIGQLIKRKGIIETVDAFCNAFTSKDKVVLFVKTFKLNYSKEEQQKCIDELVEVTDKYDHAPIVYVKENLNYDEIKSLHEIGDCYFHLTKTEGFCLGAFDAFNLNKKVIITGYGGHIEYLGKNYEGLVKYELKPLSVDESVFFQFKLNNQYNWAIPDKNDAISKLHKLSKNNANLINFGDGFYSIEQINGTSFKWMSDKNYIFINKDVEYLVLDVYNPRNTNTFSIKNEDGEIKKITINEGFHSINIPVKNSKKILIESEFFIPSENTNLSSDTRKLSCKLFKIKVRIEQKEINIDLNSINYTNEKLRELKYQEDGLTEYVGDYGEMTIRVKKVNSNGKINFGIQTSFYSHRSGWDYVVQNLSEFNNPDGVNFDGFIENAFSWRKNQYISNKIIPYKSPWVGVLHNPPNMPLWFSDNNSYPQTFLNDDLFKESLLNCKGLYVLSTYYKKFLKHYIPNIPVNVLYHPTEVPSLKFDFDSFLKNSNKSVVNIGWWLRRLNSIFLLENKNYSKIRLMPNNKCKDTILRLTNIERDLFDIKLDSYQLNSVKLIDHLSNDEYDVLLTKNIVFLDLYDTSANNAVIECIARGTPILINRHPATIEYLGEEYPFYFDNLNEASEKLNNLDLIRDTNKYLMTFDKRKQITIEYFKEQFKQSEIYQSL